MSSPAWTLPPEALGDADSARAVRIGIAGGALTILDLFDNLPWFRGGADWSAWRAWLCAVYGLPMSEREADIYRACTGRRDPPTARAREAWTIVGRRGRKSALASLCAIYEGLRDWRPYLAPGERALIPLLARNKHEAGQIHSFASAILRAPSLAPLVGVSEEERGEPLKESIALVSGTDILIRAASLTAGRSRATPLAILDEAAFFAVEGPISDEEIVRGIRPAQAALPDPLLIGMSSPYARRGLLWEAYSEHYGAEGDRVLVWCAPTLAMHDSPRLRLEIQKAYEDDPVAARAEYGAEFRDDVVAFVQPEVVRAATDAGVTERPRVPGIVYHAFVDPSGGSSDSFTLAIAHHEPAAEGLPARVLLDCLKEWPAPFVPLDVVESAAEVLRAYGLSLVWGDYYGGEWPSSSFQRLARITYYVSAKPKADIYQDSLPLLTSGTGRLLDNERLRAQLCALDRFTSRGGRDTIDHPKGAHDDVANAACGALLVAWEARSAARPVPEPKADDTREEVRRKIRDAINASLPKPPRPQDIWFRKRR